MSNVISMVLFLGGWLLRLLGGLGVLGLLFYGIYILFAKSILMGLLLIGASVVGGWIISFLSGLLILLAVGAAAVGARNSEES